MKNKKKILLFFTSLLLLVLVFFDAKAAEPSQCTGSCGSTQTCTGAAGFTAALKSQCEIRFGTGSSCSSMNNYLSKMESDCESNNQAALVGGDCSNITDGNRYGACSAIYAGYSPAPSATPNSDPTPLGIVLPTNTGLSEKTIAEILTNLLTWLLQVVGVIALIGFVVSGIQYIVATGNDKMVESAKKNMTYSLIGITVALASFVVIQALDAMLNAIEF
jgi:hypothetical protein